MKNRRQIFSVLLVPVILISLCMPSSAVYRDYTDRANVFRYKRNEDKKIALTFDDGPHHKYTAEILDILKEFEAPATFFVIGENAELYPELVRREIAEGHEVGNHTYNHPHLQRLNKARLVNELLMVEDALYEIDDYKPKLFRPPEGMCSDAIIDCAGELDYNVILWSIDTLDWAHNPPESIVKMIMDNVTDGDIILFHDYVSRVSPTPGVLRIVIPRLREQGYDFVTVSELISSG